MAVETDINKKVNPILKTTCRKVVSSYNGTFLWTGLPGTAGKGVTLRTAKWKSHPAAAIGSNHFLKILEQGANFLNYIGTFLISRTGEEIHIILYPVTTPNTIWMNFILDLAKEIKLNQRSLTYLSEWLNLHGYLT